MSCKICLLREWIHPSIITRNTLWLFLTVLIFGQGCNKGLKNSSAKNQASPTPEVEIEVLAKKTVYEQALFGGFLRSAKQRNIHSDVSGTIVSVSKKPGAQVRQGDLLMELRPRAQLRDEGPLVRIYAPFSGYLAALYTDVGEYVREGEKLVLVATSQALELYAHATSDDLGFLKNPYGIEVVADYFSEKPSRAAASIAYISPAADEATLLHKVLVKLSCKPQLSGAQSNLCPEVFRLGEFVRVVVKHSPRQSIIVADDALGRDQNSVFVLNENSEVKEIDVKLQLTDQNEFEALQGLMEGQKLVVKTSIPLRDGQKVEVSTKEAL